MANNTGAVKRRVGWGGYDNVGLVWHRLAIGRKVAALKPRLHSAKPLPLWGIIQRGPAALTSAGWEVSADKSFCPKGRIHLRLVAGCAGGCAFCLHCLHPFTRPTGARFAFTAFTLSPDQPV